MTKNYEIGASVSTTKQLQKKTIGIVIEVGSHSVDRSEFITPNYLTIINSKEDYQKIVSFSAGVKAAVIPELEVGGGFGYETEFCSSAETVYIALSYSLIEQIENTDNPILTNFIKGEIEKLYGKYEKLNENYVQRQIPNTTNLRKFVTLFGDRFVKSLAKGKLFIGVISINRTNIKDYQKFEADFNLSIHELTPKIKAEYLEQLIKSYQAKFVKILIAKGVSEALNGLTSINSTNYETELSKIEERLHASAPTGYISFELAPLNEAISTVADEMEVYREPLERIEKYAKNAEKILKCLVKLIRLRNVIEVDIAYMGPVPLCHGAQ